MIRYTRTVRPLPQAVSPVQQVQTPTQWFDHLTNPVHSGVYETMVSVLSPVLRHRWNGLVWVCEMNGTPELFQQRMWRGICEKPGEF